MRVGVQWALERRTAEGLLRLELRLQVERKEILLQEELLRKQKSRNDWLKDGDDNTRFFHTSTLVRRRRNRVESLKNDGGIWVEDKKGLKETAMRFYTDLFSSNSEAGGDFIKEFSRRWRKVSNRSWRRRILRRNFAGLSNKWGL